jgi:hypothetical protein
MNSKLFRVAVVAIVCVATVLPVGVVQACPFCNAAMQTLSQELESASVALIAVLEKPMPLTGLDDPATAESAAATFRVVQVLRGGEFLKGAKTIEVVYFGEEAPDKEFFITGLAGVTGPDTLDWTNPIPLSLIAADYIRKLPTVPVEGADRLAFFQEYLRSDDPLLMQDSYDEFARSPYAALIALEPRMNRGKLVEWINDSQVGPASRRLFLTMLGICGKTDDVAMLEALMNYDYLRMQPGIAAALAASMAVGPNVGAGLVDEMIHTEERRRRESLDALVACYLKLKGPDGMALVEELFLKNPKVDYTQLHSVIMALRFHGEETDVIPKERLLESMRLVLDHHDLADQVITDLTRWEDWEIMPRLVEMFKESEEGDWIRQPVAAYLLVAEEQEGNVGEQATAAIAELETLDPETVKRARATSAFGGFLQRASEAGAAGNAKPGELVPGSESIQVISPPPGAEDDTIGAEGKATSVEDGDATGSEAGDAGQGGAADVTVAPDQSPDDNPRVPGVPRTETVADAKGDDGKTVETPALVAAALVPPSKIKIIGIPLLAAVVLLGVFAVLLRGSDPRSSDDA